MKESLVLAVDGYVEDAELFHFSNGELSEVELNLATIQDVFRGKALFVLLNSLGGEVKVYEEVKKIMDEVRLKGGEVLAYTQMAKSAAAWMFLDADKRKVQADANLMWHASYCEGVNPSIFSVSLSLVDRLYANAAYVSERKRQMDSLTRDKRRLLRLTKADMRALLLREIDAQLEKEGVSAEIRMTAHDLLKWGIVKDLVQDRQALWEDFNAESGISLSSIEGHASLEKFFDGVVEVDKDASWDVVFSKWLSSLRSRVWVGLGVG